MSSGCCLGVFEREKDMLQAADAVREQGWQVQDIYSPYPIHGTARALGLARCRLPRAAFVFGALGVGFAFWFQFWASAWDWPINVGGRPWNSLPAFVPVAFEMMVLFAGLGVVLSWLVVCRLFPGKTAALPSLRVTDDQFALVVLRPRPDADSEIIFRLFRECGGYGMEESEAR
jgi:hypothetical protein